MYINYGAGMSLGVEGETEDFNLAKQYIHRFAQDGSDVFYPLNIKSDSKVYTSFMGSKEKNQFDSKDYLMYSKIAFATFWVEAAKDKLRKNHKTINQENIIRTMKLSRNDILKLFLNIGPNFGEKHCSGDEECVDKCVEDLKNYDSNILIEKDSLEGYMIDLFKANRERAKIFWEIKTKCCGGRVLERTPNKSHKKDKNKDFGPTM